MEINNTVNFKCDILLMRTEKNSPRLSRIINTADKELDSIMIMRLLKYVIRRGAQRAPVKLSTPRPKFSHNATDVVNPAPVNMPTE